MNNYKRTVLYKLLIMMVLSLLICLNRMAVASAFITDIPALLLVAFGGALPFEGIGFYESLIVAIPIVTKFILFSEFVSADMPTVSVYIFSRTRNRAVWLFNKLAKLALLSALCSYTCIGMGICVGFFAGLNVNSYLKLVSAIQLLTVTWVAWSMLMVCVVAVICIKHKAHIVTAASAGVFIIWVFSVCFIPSPANQYIIPFVPMSNSLLAAHSGIGMLEFLADRLGERAYIFPVWWSIIYFVFIALAFILITRYWIMKTDFIETR